MLFETVQIDCMGFVLISVPCGCLGLHYVGLFNDDPYFIRAESKMQWFNENRYEKCSN